MSIELPSPIANYFAADVGNGESVVECFTPDAVVEDESHTYRGMSEIRQWRADVAKKYTYTCEPLSVTEVSGKTIVLCHLEGNFPGNQVDLRFSFRLADGKIAELSVTP